jgi:protease-4
MGMQARDNGLVDNLGGLDEAIAYIRGKAKLSAGGDTNLVMYPPRRSLFELLANSSPESFEDSLSQSRMQRLVPGLPERLPGLSFLRGGILSRLPYSLTVH